MFLGNIGVPISVVNTSPDSFQLTDRERLEGATKAIQEAEKFIKDRTVFTPLEINQTRFKLRKKDEGKSVAPFEVELY
jgi:hypothetical protein